MDPIDNIQKSYSVSNILDDLPLDNLNMTYQPLSINFNQLLLNSWNNLNNKPKENKKKKVVYPFFKNVNFDKKSLGLNDCFMYDKHEKDCLGSDIKNSQEHEDSEDSEEDSADPFTGKRKEASKLVHYNNYYGWKKRRIESVELRGDGDEMMGRGVRINDFFI